MSQPEEPSPAIPPATPAQNGTSATGNLPAGAPTGEAPVPAPPPASPPPAHPEGEHLIGEVILRNALATPEQMEEALALQRKAHEAGIRIKLGEVLLQQNVIDMRTLDALLKLQMRRVADVRDPLTFRRKGLTPKEDQTLGQIAVDNGLITAAKLDQVLELQRKAREMGIERRLGELLVEEGAVPADTLDALLQVQKKRFARSA